MGQQQQQQQQLLQQQQQHLQVLDVDFHNGKEMDTVMTITTMMVVATMLTQNTALNVNVLILILKKMIAMIGNGTHSGVKGRKIKGNVTDLMLLKGAKKLVSTAKNYLLKLQLNLHVKTNG